MLSPFSGRGVGGGDVVGGGVMREREREKYVCLGSLCSCLCGSWCVV